VAKPDKFDWKPGDLERVAEAPKPTRYRLLKPLPEEIKKKLKARKT
jgi:hypothetical protein